MAAVVDALSSPKHSGISPVIKNTWRGVHVVVPAGTYGGGWAVTTCGQGGGVQTRHMLLIIASGGSHGSGVYVPAGGLHVPEVKGTVMQAAGMTGPVGTLELVVRVEVRVLSYFLLKPGTA
jgi:hypothetical protein